MNNVDKQYFELIRYILKNGVEKKDRTGTGTISIFDYTMKFNMSDGFPLMTSKKMFTKGIIHELIWFLKGDTNIKYLIDNDVHIWDGDAYKNYKKWADEHTKQYLYQPYTKEQFVEQIKNNKEFAEKWGELGPVYGAQWRAWGEYFYTTKLAGKTYIDQIANLINELKTNPDSRRLMVSAWNVSEINNMVLPPCHYGFQCYTSELSLDERRNYFAISIGKSEYYADDLSNPKLDALNVPKRKLSLKWNQRSVDSGLGLPYNITSYALLLSLLAKEVNMIVDELIFSGGDCHIYSNHVDALKKQLTNETYDLPKLKLKNKSIDNIKYEDFEITGYKSSDTIKMQLSN